MAKELTLEAIESILDSSPKVIPKQNKLDYYNIGTGGLSYSRSLTLHACPRKFELDSKYAIKGNRNSVTFAYGHAVGDGVQAVLSGEPMNLSLVRTMLAYDFDEEDRGNDNERAQKKSIWWALLNVEMFYKQYHAGIYTFLDGWEIATITAEDGTTRKASELSFVIDCMDGNTFEGHIDLVLYHPEKNRYMVLELKTTGMHVVNEASFKNSAQALGYGVVVDAIAGNLKASASYDVLYMVYKSTSQEIVPMLFTKTPVMRAQWLNAVISDFLAIEKYEELGYYPHHGESCFNYFRECEYMASECHMSDSLLSSTYGKNDSLEVNDEGEAIFIKMETPDYFFTIQQLADRQSELLRFTNSSNELSDPDMLLDITSL